MEKTVTVNGVVLTETQVRDALAQLEHVPHLAVVTYKGDSKRRGVVLRKGSVQRTWINASGLLPAFSITVVDDSGCAHSYTNDASLLVYWKPI